jgi:hypothetical protein
LNDRPIDKLADYWWRTSEPVALWPLYEDFKVFLRLVWAYLRLPSPTPIQLDIADYLQNGPQRSIVMAFRGVGKSWITAAFVMWLLFRNVQLSIMVVSASKDRADNFSIFVLRVLEEMPELMHLYPLASQRASSKAFDVAGAQPDQAPSVRSIGMFGQMTGGRADVLIPDDVEVPNNSETPASREKLAHRVTEFDAILKPETGFVKGLGTPQTEETVYSTLETRGYEIRVWPAEFPDSKAVERYGTRLAPMVAAALDRNPALAGEPTEPRRFPTDVLARNKLNGRAYYALQFMLDTTLADAELYPLKLKDLMIWDINPDEGPEKFVWASGPQQVLEELTAVGFTGDRFHAPLDCSRDERGNIQHRKFQGAAMHIDPSGRGKDECAYAVTKMLNGYIFLVASGAVLDYSEASLSALAHIAKKHQVNEVVVESNFGDGMFTALLKPVMSKVYPCTITEERVSGQKEKRMLDALEPVLASHKLVVDRKVVEEDYTSTLHHPLDKQNSYRLFYQLTRLTSIRGCLVHDDRLDALAAAVQYWVNSMSRDVDKALDAHRAEALDEALKQFVSNTAQGRAAESGAGAFNFDP